MIAYDMPSDSLAENGYNGALMAKGLLLHSEMELSTLLKESGDEEIERKRRRGGGEYLQRFEKPASANQ